MVKAINYPVGCVPLLLLISHLLCFFFFGFSLQKLKEKNLDDWKNIRGPRPWEDSRQYQEQQRSR